MPLWKHSAARAIRPREFIKREVLAAVAPAIYVSPTGASPPLHEEMIQLDHLPAVAAEVCATELRGGKGTVQYHERMAARQ